MIVRVIPLLAVAMALCVISAGAGATRDLYAAVGIQQANRAPAPTFALPTLDGGTVDSNGLRGKVIVLNFWATWCGPCKEEMPSMQRLQQAFPATDLALLAITTDQQHQAITDFAKSLGLAFPILIDESKDISAAFGVRGLPTTVIIDREGQMVGRAIGPRQWDGSEAIALLRGLLQ